MTNSAFSLNPCCVPSSHPYTVAVDFEGVALSRTGSLCIVQVAPADGPVILFDIVEMQRAAFDEGGLADLIQSEHVLKLWFDCRSDADALVHLYGRDVQPALIGRQGLTTIT